MKILLARTAGFCMGVRRAMEIAVDTVGKSNKSVCTYGPLIHNRQVIELLNSRGISDFDSDNVSSGDAVIIRAHGVPPEEREKLISSELEIVDATCPHVLLSQKRIRQASEEGKEVVLAGDRNHPEVLGLAGHADTKVWMIDSADDARDISPENEFIVIGQTTFQKDLYDEICKILTERFPECKVFNSICDATDNRQAEARQIARKAEAMVVVGGKHSANTRRLAEIGREEGIPTFHVETADELVASDFDGIRCVGVTAGASTPGWLTQHVIDRLHTFGVKTPLSYLWEGLLLVAKARAVTALGAAALCHAAASLMNAQGVRLAPLMVALQVFFAYIFNRREAPEETSLLIPVDSFFRNNRKILLPLSAASLVGSMAVAIHIGVNALILVSIANIAAVFYSIRILPRGFRHSRLKDLPASKDILVALSWAVIVVGSVMLEATTSVAWPAAVACGVVIFITILTKTVMLDLRDTESDHLIGIETLPVLMGRAKTVRALYKSLIVMEVILILAAVTGMLGHFAYIFSIVPAYGALALWFLSKFKFRGEAQCQLVIDAQLLLSGAFSLLWVYL